MKLRTWRESRELTRKEVAFRLKCSVKTVGQWESGQSIPRTDDMQAIYEMTDTLVQPNDFYEFDAEPKHGPSPVAAASA